MTKIDPARLKQLRNSKGWSQDQLADYTKFGRHPKIDARTISRIESGKQANTHGSTAQKLARALGVELAVLTGEAPTFAELPHLLLAFLLHLQKFSLAREACA